MTWGFGLGRRSKTFTHRPPNIERQDERNMHHISVCITESVLIYINDNVQFRSIAISACETENEFTVKPMNKQMHLNCA